jgi:GT2 family glycosyltransferase/tetratricopeptide (TPR) repeat protein
MITCAAFTWYHLPRSGGTATAYWWAEVASRYGLNILIDRDDSTTKHDNCSTRQLRERGFRRGGPASVMNFRRLPAWLESNYRYACRQGLDVPEARYLAGEFFSFRLGKWCPADWWLDYFDAGNIDRLVPLERLEEALQDLLQSAFGLPVPQGLTLPRMNSISAEIPFGADWPVLDWSEAYRQNPAWAELEGRAYGATEALKAKADKDVLPAIGRHLSGGLQAPPAQTEALTRGANAIGELLTAGRFTQALAVAIRQMREEGESSSGHVQIANIEMLLGFPQRAERSWRRALQLRDCAEMRLGLGICLYQAGLVPQALDEFRLGLAFDGDSLALLTAASIAAAMLGDFSAGAEFARHAVSLDPANPEAMLCMARAELGLGHIPPVRLLIRELERLGYKPDEVALLQAEVFHADANYAAALMVASDLCDRHPASLTSLAAFRTALQSYKAHAPSFAFDELASSLSHPPAPELTHSAPPKVDLSGVTVDIIIPVHNAWEKTERAVKAVLTHSGPLIGRLILVDDGSSVGTATALSRMAAETPQITLLRCPERQGFTRAMVEGLNHSTAAAFVALNSDTIVTPGWLTRLYAGLRSTGDVAIVGPLSNNAAWQNYGAVFGATGEFIADPIPDAAMQTEIATRLMGFGAGKLAETSMVHGFCALVDRKAYDAIGGLDEAAFPEGYGEFQDLSYRMRDSGYRLCVALDTVVFHEQGASLAPATRAKLSLAGRQVLYERYSAFTYLFVESACAWHRDMVALRRHMARNRAAA